VARSSLGVDPDFRPVFGAPSVQRNARGTPILLTMRPSTVRSSSRGRGRTRKR